MNLPTNRNQLLRSGAALLLGAVITGTALFTITSFEPEVDPAKSVAAGIEEELTRNPHLNETGLRVELVDVADGYVTLAVRSGPYPLRWAVEDGADVTTSDGAIDALPPTLRRAGIAIRKAVEAIRTVPGVRSVLVTAPPDVDGERRDAEELLAAGDAAAALVVIRRLAARGDAAAQILAANMLENGIGTPPDLTAALQYLAAAADQGLTDAQARFGFALHYGRGIPANPAAAVPWYRKAAKAGQALAQRGLGLLYAEGTGVERDLEHAVLWLRLAAGQGYAPAQNDLAWVLAATPRKELQNGGEAVEWALRAVAQDVDSWAFLSTLAAAYARNGDFRSATDTQRRMLARVEEVGGVWPEPQRREVLATAKERLALFRKKRAYTDSSLG